MALLDLQTLEVPEDDGMDGGGANSNLSVTGCPGKSSLSLLSC
ncbi:SapB/AmfS family lanthipeptide [Streptomyces sp. NPDC002814]|jgi:hypothetical protein|nr:MULTISPECIES: SapB/AmfS family lanthipeptide [unclassified Streptomyces]